MLSPLSVETLLNVQKRGTGLFITEAELAESSEALYIDLPRDARIATDQGGRWELSQAQNSRWRWAAGGAVLLLRLRDVTVAVASVSDKNLPVWPGHLTAATGFAASEAEWVRPLLLMREAFRSIAVATPTGLAVPSFGDPELDALSFGTLPSVMRLIGLHDLPSLYHMDLFNIVGSVLLPLRGEKDMVISVGGVECSRTRALAVFDPQTRGIDLMHAFEMDLRVNTLEEISVFHAKEADGRARDAEICLLELDAGMRPVRIARSYRSGAPVEGAADAAKLSPVLRQTLEAL